MNSEDLALLLGLIGGVGGGYFGGKRREAREDKRIEDQRLADYEFKKLMREEEREYQKQLEEEEKQRNRKNYVAPHHGQVHGNGGGNGGGGGGAADIPDRNRGGYATDDTASFFARGGRVRFLNGGLADLAYLLRLK